MSGSLPDPLLLGIWAIAGLPYLSIVKKFKLGKKRRQDYSYFVQWKEFPLIKILLAKLTFFSLLGIASIVYLVPLEKTILGITALGTCGLILETTVTRERPYPTQGYVQRQMVCSSCQTSNHENCVNLRMLDGFEKNFKSKEGFYRPVCCCGFRISDRQEACS
jgi:hypothetical protein